MSVRATKSMKARGVVYLGSLPKRRHAFLWDGTEVVVVHQSPGSTLVRYVESGARVHLSHQAEVTLSRRESCHEQST